jgi:DNA-binding transcriptional ArsR family regulator/predicted DNA-binding protein (MmcQ/YjbR family)
MLDTQEKLDDLAGVLAALAHASRLHILMVVLVHGGTMSAGEVAGRFSHSWPTTSRHLRVLEQAGLLQFEKQGRTRVYRVDSDRLHIVRDWLRWFEQPPQEIAEPAAVRPEHVLREIALAYPDAQEERTEGKRVIKVRRRPFLLLEADDRRLNVSTRLPASHAAALKLPFVQAVQYRLGKSDWICATFQPGEEIPLELLWEWIDESYRAVAPRKVLARLPAPPPAPQSAAGRKNGRDT